MIKHHVKEEEQRDGMFARAKKSDLDLDELGEQLQTRKTRADEAEKGPLTLRITNKQPAASSAAGCHV